MNRITNSTSAGNDNCNTRLPQSTAASNVNLSITVKNGIATLFGTTDSAAEATLTENLVLQMDGVDNVINLITTH